MRILPLFIVSISCLPSITVAQENSLESYWDAVDVYQGDDATFSFSGRLHGNGSWSNSDDGEYDDTEWRRFRFGGKGKVNKFSYKLEADFDLNDGGKYKKLTDANISWKTASGNKIKILKQSAGFTLDGATSSNKLKTLERSNIANNLWFTKEYFNGVNFSGKTDESIAYQAGIYSSDASEEIGFGAGVFALGSLTYQANQSSYWDSAIYRVDYVFNEEHREANTRDFGQVFSASTRLTKSNWGLDAEFSGGKGYFEQSDLWGFSAMPYVDLNEKVQLVARYTYMKSDEENGLRLNRYEAKAVDGRGDEYQELYAGMNYFINSHKLKLQIGAQYTDMTDSANDGGEYQGLSFTVGLRAYW